MANKNKIIGAAQKYISKGQWDRAIKELQKLVAEDPSDVRTLLKLGDVYSKKGDRENASKVYKQVAESYSEQGFFLKAVAVYKQILKHEPKHLDVTLKLAELYEHLGLQSEAMQQYQVAAAIHDEQGETKQSLEVLERMVELDADNVASRIKLAESYSREEMTEQAAEQFERAAEILKSQARIDDYIKVAERLVYHAPDRLGVVMDLAKLYLQRGDTKRGLAKLQICFKANPREIETLRLLAQAFNDLGQTQKTVFVYRELARIYDEAGRPDEARSVHQMILEVDPNDPNARDALGLSAPAGGGAPELEEPIFSTPAPVEEPEALADVYDAALVDSPSLMPSSTPSFAPSLAPRPAPPPQRFPPTDAGVPTDDEVLILDEPEEIYSAPPPAAPPPRISDREQINKILTETDVYIKYGLREKALEHLRGVFDVDPDNVGAYYKMRDIYVALGDNARAAEALANLLHVHARRGDVDALNAARSELEQLAPGHPLVAGGLPGAIPAPLAEYDLDSIDIMEDSADFEVEISDIGPVDGTGDLHLGFDEGPDFSGFDTTPPESLPEAATEAPLQNDAALAAAHRHPLSEDLPLVTDSQVLDLDSSDLRRGETDRHPLILSEADDELWVDDEGATVAALPDEADDTGLGVPALAHPLDYREGADADLWGELEPAPAAGSGSVDAQSLAGPAGLREAAPEYVDEPSTDAFGLDNAVDDDDVDSPPLLDDDDLEDLVVGAPPEDDASDPELEDELDEAEFLVQADLFDEARETLLAILDRAPNYPRAVAMLAALPGEDDDDTATADGPSTLSADVDGAFGALAEGPTEADETTAEDHYDQGMAFKELGRTDDAIREFEGALASDRRRITSFEMIGLCFMDKNEPESAIDYFTRAMEAGAEGSALVNLKYEIGSAYASAGAMDEAVQWFYDCARDDPEHRGVTDRLRDMGVTLTPESAPPENGAYRSQKPETPKLSKKSKISYL